MNLFDLFDGKNEPIEENLRKWFKEKWVRFGPDGKIRGDCARGDDSEGKPKCLPQSKAQALGKEGRASAAARKRRQDPNPERSGKAINVATKKKTNEGVAEGLESLESFDRGVINHMQDNTWLSAERAYFRMIGLQKKKDTRPSEYEQIIQRYIDLYDKYKGQQSVAEGLNEMDKSAPQPGRDGKVSHSTYGSRDKKGSDYFKGKEAPGKPVTAKQMSKDALDILKKQGVAEGSLDPSGLIAAAAMASDYIITAEVDGKTKKFRIRGMTGPRAAKERFLKHHSMAKVLDVKPDQGVAEEQLDEKCWDTHKQVGVKSKGSKMVPNCVPKESVEEAKHSCPHCGGPMFEAAMMNEKKDACYYKVKSRYKVWPSAYASGALVQCRKKGAANWGNKSESVNESESDSGRPRIRRYTVLRPDGSKAVRYEVLNYKGVLVQGGFDDIQYAREYALRNYERISAPYSSMEEATNPTDTVKMDVPLLLRVMEYSKEDAKTDMDLHDVVTNLVDMSKTGETLTMKNYNDAVEDTQEPAPDLSEPSIAEQSGRYWCKTDRRWKDR